MLVELKELEQLIYQEKFTIWELARQYNISIHVAVFRMLKNASNHDTDTFEKLKRCLKINSETKVKVHDIRFSKDEFIKAVDNGKTVTDFAEEMGYYNSLVLYRYLTKLFEGDVTYPTLLERFKKNQPSKSSHTARPKTKILLTSDFIVSCNISRFKQYLKDTFNNENEFECQILKFTFKLFVNKNEIINKILSFPNLKFIEYDTFYEFNRYSSNIIDLSQITYDKKVQRLSFLADNDIVLKYLVEHMKEKILVATMNNNLIISCKKIGKDSICYTNKQKYLTTSSLIFYSDYATMVSNELSIFTDTNAIYKLNSLKNLNTTIVILENVIKEIPYDIFIEVLEFANSSNSKIYFNINPFLNNYDFVYNDMAILVNTLLSAHFFRNIRLMTNDHLLKFEALFSNVEVVDSSNIAKLNSENLTNFVKIPTNEKVETSKKVSMLPSTNKTEKKSPSVKKISKENEYETIQGKIEKGCFVINTTNVDSVYDQNKKKVFEITFGKKNRKCLYKLKAGYYIKLTSISHLYNLISYTQHNNLILTDIKADSLT